MSKTLNFNLIDGVLPEETRSEIYKLAYRFYTSGSRWGDRGLCKCLHGAIINLLCGFLPDQLYVYNHVEILPEIFAHMPKDGKRKYWWSLKRRSIREKILLKAIEATNPKNDSHE